MVQKRDNAYNPIQGGGATPPDGAGGFIRFEGTNTLYNVYDACNFMTGKAFQMIGASAPERSEDKVLKELNK